MLGDLRKHLVTDARATLRLDRSALHPKTALRAALVTTALTAAGMLMQSPAASIWLAIGALFTYLSEGTAPLGRRTRLMAWTSIWLSAGVLLGSVVSPWAVAILLVTPIIAVICGFIGAAGPRAALIGVMSLVLFTISAGTPSSLGEAFASAGYVLAGGLVQTAVSIAAGLIRRQPWDVDATSPILERLHAHRGVADDFVRHAIRLAIAVTIATGISLFWEFQHAYWIPMTVAWMTRPDTDGTVTRVSGRLLGTIVGLALVFLTFQVTTVSNGAVIMVIAVSSYLAALFIFANYAIAVIGITILVVTLFTLAGDPVQETVPLRMLATVLAACIVLPASLLLRRSR